MKLQFISLLFCIPFTFALGQEPILVSDFNSGPDDSYSAFNYVGINVGDQLIFPISSNEIGEELAVVSNGGELAVLKDINPGEASSTPSEFTLFNGQHFFSAYDDVNGGALWTTDGTEEGTQLFFAPDTRIESFIRPEGLIVSASGYLYFTHDSQLFRTDGTTTENLFSNVDFETAFQQVSNTYATYQDEVAFLTNIGDSIQLYTVENDTVVQLGAIAEGSNFGDLFGLSQVENGLIFGVDDSFDDDVNGTYVYDEVSGNIEQISINGNEARRLVTFTDQQSLAWVGGSGYYSTNGVAGEEELLFGSSNTSFTQGNTATNAVYQGKMIFHGGEGFFGDDFLFYTDGTTAGTSNLLEISQFHSNFLLAGKYAIFASGTSNGFDPEFYYVDMEDGSLTNFFNSDSSSNNTRSVLMIGAIDQTLYFISNLVPAVGRELYSIELDVDTPVKDFVAFPHTVELTPTSFRVISDTDTEILARAYNTGGQLLDTFTGNSNGIFDFSHLRGMILLRIEADGAFTTRKVFRP